MPKLIQQRLILRLTDKDEYVRASVIVALGQLRELMSKTAAQAIFISRLDPNSLVQMEAVKVLTLVQQNGLRFIGTAATIDIRLVSDLSATTPNPDGCCTTPQRSSYFSLAC